MKKEAYLAVIEKGLDDPLQKLMEFYTASNLEVLSGELKTSAGVTRGQYQAFPEQERFVLSLDMPLRHAASMRVKYDKASNEPVFVQIDNPEQKTIFMYSTTWEESRTLEGQAREYADKIAKIIWNNIESECKAELTATFPSMKREG